MSPERWREVEAVYHKARESGLSALDGAAPEVRREVEELLSQSGDNSIPDRQTETVGLAGQTVSHYRILEMLGAGGMGIVYKAFDLRLGRLVALKFLPPETRHDSAWKRRLAEEARAASALDHPNIVVIYDIDESPDGGLFIAMAFHEGFSLRDLLRKGVPPQEALEIARQIARGLAKAHAHAIVHRDIKPANVIVARDGVVRIIDFGLAKASDATATIEGVAKGTPLYMSPEQAAGKPVDGRTDLWSLGAVLYEMLAGRAPFVGEGQLQVMHAIIHDEPAPLRSLRPDVSPEVEAIVARALQKDPERRYQTAEDMLRDLSAAIGPTSTGAAATPPSFFRRRIFYAAAAFALVAGAAAAWRILSLHRPVTSPTEYAALTDFSDSVSAPALSPDGRMLAFLRGEYFLTNGQVYVKLLPSGESKQLTSDPREKYAVTFTPDGSRVAYTIRDIDNHDWETWTVPVLGGSPSHLMANAAGLGWIAPDRVLFSEIEPGTVIHMGIVAAKENRADEHAIYFPAHPHGMAHYSWQSPDRGSVLLVEMDESKAWLRCRVVPMDGSSSGIQVGPPGACSAAAWSPDGEWMYFNASVQGGAHLWRQGWRNHAPAGDPEQITFGPTEEEGLAVDPSGRSLIASVGVRRNSVWIHDASGERMISQEGSASQPRLSSDGKRVYYLLQRNNQSEERELWMKDLASGKDTAVLTGLRTSAFDISRDEALIAFVVAGPGGPDIHVAPTDRSAPPRLLVRGGDSLSIVGSQLIFRQFAGKTFYLARIGLDGKGLERILDTPIEAKFGGSPDGAWISLADNGTYLVSTQGKPRRHLCRSVCDPQWSPDGRYLYVTLGYIDDSATYVMPFPKNPAQFQLPGNLDQLQTTPPGFHLITESGVAGGIDADTYLVAKSTFQGNLFRIPLH